MKIERVTLAADTPAAVSFDTVCGKWLVKNFSENDCFVSFDEDAEQDDCIKIAAGMGQVVVDNEFHGGLDVFKHDTIYMIGNGEVEVQQLCYKD